MTTTTRARIRRSGVAVAAAAVATATALSAAPAVAQPQARQVPPAAAVESSIPCTPLHVIGFHGTGQSGEQANPTVDSGFLGDAVTRPLLQAAQPFVSRQLVAYAADFGFQNKPYVDSMTGGLAEGLRTIAEYGNRCKDSKIALIGFSQGAQIADEIARMIGAGDANAPVKADRIAAVSLFSSPIRENESAIFPGTTQRLSPTVPAGLPSTVLAELLLANPTPAPGAGLAPKVGRYTSYGRLTGMVASWCNGGDVACSTPADAPLARTLANLGGQIHFSAQDPLRTVTEIANALGGSVLRTAAGVINNDVNFSNGRFSVNNSGKTILGRLAENSDPRSATPQADSDIIRAVIKTGVMGFNAAVTVAQKVLTPATIASLVAVGMANPVGALADLGMKLAGAVLDLVPPATISSGVRYIFNEVTKDVTDNAGLVRMATDLRYWNSGAQHTSYDVAQVGVDGQTPARYTVDWFAALAKAFGEKATTTPSSPPSKATTTLVPSKSATPAPSK
ncbi:MULTISPECIES: cutinase family protein [Nocardia]|uniref:cutinase family protein n=1 Tax=Nocardia TaxID=1817 RepID=UPI0024590C46|nr:MULTISPECIES: cutinase family protein [Nocardia]